MICHRNPGINKSRSMKSYQVNWKITVFSNKLRLIIIRINRTGRPKTARFRVTHFTEKSSFFFFTLFSILSRLSDVKKWGPWWAGGYSNLQEEMNESQKSIHSRTWLQASSRENRAGNFSRFLSFACSRCHVDTPPEHLREYRMWCTAIFSAIFLGLSHDYVCIALC